jgi:hypothetical protein
MKLLIVEGLDRCGKDTLISAVSKDYRHVVKRHWSYPVGDTNKEKTLYQKNSFMREFYLQHLIRNSPEFSKDSIFIWNRAHLGEYVYGTLYRFSDPESWIPDLEKSYHFDTDPEIYLVFLYADPDFIVGQEDGKSYSSSAYDKQQEILKFEDAFNKSLIKNKLKIKVNNGNNYISTDEIFEQVNRFLSI